MSTRALLPAFSRVALPDMAPAITLAVLAFDVIERAVRLDVPPPILTVPEPALIARLAFVE